MILVAYRHGLRASETSTVCVPAPIKSGPVPAAFLDLARYPTCVRNTPLPTQPVSVKSLRWGFGCH